MFCCLVAVGRIGEIGLEIEFVLKQGMVATAILEELAGSFEYAGIRMLSPSWY